MNRAAEAAAQQLATEVRLSIRRVPTTEQERAAILARVITLLTEESS